MKRTIIIFFLLTGCYNDFENLKINPKDSSIENDLFRIGSEKTVLIMGDSRGKLGGTWDLLPYTIHNVAEGSTTTRSIISRLHFVDEINPDVIILFTGINDASWLSGDEFQENLEYIIYYIQSRGIKLYIMDISYNPYMLSKYKYLTNERIMMAYVGNYINMNYTESDFIDFAHFSESGMQKVSDALINAIGI